MRVLWCVLLAAAPMWSAFVNLNDAVVVSASNASLQEKTAVRILVEEVAKRSQIRWPVVTAWPAVGKPAIAVGSAARSRMANVPEGMGAEGYHVRTAASGVLVAANSGRGTVFGVGRLLP